MEDTVGIHTIWLEQRRDVLWFSALHCGGKESEAASQLVLSTGEKGSGLNE